MEPVLLDKVLEGVVASIVASGAIVAVSDQVLAHVDGVGKVLSCYLEIWVPHPAPGEAAQASIT